MEERYRWISIKHLGRTQISQLAEAMQKKLYGRNVKSGYTLTTVRSELIEGAFTERVDYVETITDHLGGDVSIQRVEFRRIEFRISSTYPELELRNPCRSVRPLLNTIADTLDYQVAVTEIASRPLEWAAAIAQAGNPVQVLGVRSAKFSLSNEAHASFVVAGTADVRRLLPDLIGRRRVDVSSLQCVWGLGSEQWRVELKSTGAACVFRTAVEKPSKLLRTALAGVSQPAS